MDSQKLAPHESLDLHEVINFKSKRQTIPTWFVAFLYVIIS